MGAGSGQWTCGHLLDEADARLPGQGRPHVLWPRSSCLPTLCSGLLPSRFALHSVSFATLRRCQTRRSLALARMRQALTLQWAPATAQSPSCSSVLGSVRWPSMRKRPLTTCLIGRHRLVQGVKVFYFAMLCLQKQNQSGHKTKRCYQPPTALPTRCLLPLPLTAQLPAPASASTR